MQAANAPVNAGYGELRAVDYLLLPYVIARLLGKHAVMTTSSGHITQSVTTSKHGRFPSSPSSNYQQSIQGQTLISGLISNSTS